MAGTRVAPLPFGKLSVGTESDAVPLKESDRTGLTFPRRKEGTQSTGGGLELLSVENSER